jgi:type IV pilus assembly protein PilN
MIRINLLPHREERRKELKSQFYSLLVLAAVLGAAITLLVGLYYSAQITAQNERNNFIKEENAKLDESIKEVSSLKQEIEALKARQQAVEDLQGDRNQPVYMMNEIVRLAPEGLYLIEMKQEAQLITLQGYGQSHAVISNFLTLLNTSQWMNRPEIIVNKGDQIGKDKDAKKVINFTMVVGIKRPRELESSSASAAKATVPVAKNP